MYSTRPGLILGLHGCDAAVANKVIGTGTGLIASVNDYDWLGNGIYFWENSPDRALHYATELQQRPGRSSRPVKKPSVIGAIIDLGFCLDLVNLDSLELLEKSYQTLKKTTETLGIPLPKNKRGGAADDAAEDLLLRKLDCLVIQSLHDARQQEEQAAYDSVRGVFWEGQELYPTAGFRLKNHIQLCIRNPNCIKGYFHPRKLDEAFATV